MAQRTTENKDGPERHLSYVPTVMANWPYSIFPKAPRKAPQPNCDAGFEEIRNFGTISRYWASQNVSASSLRAKLRLLLCLWGSLKLKSTKSILKICTKEYGVSLTTIICHFNIDKDKKSTLTDPCY
jgi:hypothetical protein